MAGVGQPIPKLRKFFTKYVILDRGKTLGGFSIEIKTLLAILNFTLRSEARCPQRRSEHVYLYSHEYSPTPRRVN